MADTHGTSWRPDPDAGPARVQTAVDERSRPEDRDGLSEIGTDTGLIAPLFEVGQRGLAIVPRLVRWRPVEDDHG